LGYGSAVSRTLRLKNTFSRAIEPFEPLDPAGQVTLYSCGPTVYSYAHIGNFRSFLFADVLRRVLEQHGYSVRHVMNVTDVGHMTVDHIADAEGEDKLSKAARELGTDPYAVAAHYERLFVEDATALRLKLFLGDEGTDPSRHPRATRHVAEMLVMIQRLLERGYAYVDGAGQVYFSVEKFPEYGNLSGKVIEELEAGARVAVRHEKQDPRDFALWKVDDKHLMRWDPHSTEGWPKEDWDRLVAALPGGVDRRIRPGFPGWHIECSAMALAHLGELVDLHSGGEDNIFPHHECEIAQSYGAHEAEVPAPDGARGADAGAKRKTFSRYWIHGRHLLVDGKKMSRRDGTFFTARDLFDAKKEGRPELAERLVALGFEDGRVSPNVLRYALVSNPYTQPMNFSFDLLVQSKASVERIQSCFHRLREVASSASTATPPTDEVRALLDKHLEAFDDALDDNLNVPNALAAVFELVSALNQREASLGPDDSAAALDALDHCDEVLVILDRRVRSGLVTKAEIEASLAAHSDTTDAIVAPLDAPAILRAIVRRQAARKAKDFAGADAIREAMKNAGVVIEDLPAGVRWKLV
jgi:cysteinyl-tRNA synthetase